MDCQSCTGLYLAVRKIGLPLFLPAFFIPAIAAAFQAKVEPSAIRPGDAFVIRAKGPELREAPVATIGDRRITMQSCGTGCFWGIGAIDVESRSGTHRILLSAGKREKVLKLNVKRTRYPTQFLALPDEKVALSPADLKRAETEDERLKNIWQASSERLFDEKFLMPLESEVSTAFGVRRVINNKKISVHRGIDIRGDEGEEVMASNQGRVVLAEELFFGGRTVILDHGLGVFTVYMHLSDYAVSVGEVVPKGGCIGFVGSTGRASGPHLHFGVKAMGTSVNPVSFLDLKL